MISSESLNAEEIVPWIAPQLLVDEQLANGEEEEEDSGKIELELHQAELEKAREAGFAAGLKQGQAEVQDKGEQEKAHLSQLIEALHRPLLDFDNEVNAELLRFALALTRRMLKREVESDHQYYYDLLQRVCEDYALSSQSATVSMHPEDVLLLNAEPNTEHRSLLPRVIADETLSRGSCLVDAGQFFVNAGIDTLLDKIVAELQVDFAVAPEPDVKE